MASGDVELTLEPEVKGTEIFLPPPPTYLTRFYGNVCYAREVFQTSSITFVHASCMNDPFDPYFQLINDFEDRYAAVTKWIKDTHGTKEIRWFKNIIPYTSWTNIVNDIRRKDKSLRSTLFLFCASAPHCHAEPSQNLYMWGHYCAGHRGIAIEFDAERVAASIREHQTRINPEWPKELKVWTPVIYREKIERLTPADFYDFLKASPEKELETKLAAHFNTVSRSKSTVWQPEQEWRLMWRNDEVKTQIYKVPILPGSVHRVFIGLRMADELAAQIATECRAVFPGAEILKGAARPGEFALDFRPI